MSAGELGLPIGRAWWRFPQELVIHVITLYEWRKAWRLQAEVVPATQKDPQVWGSACKFTGLQETAGLSATELGGYCRDRDLFPQLLDRWRQDAQDASSQRLMPMAEHKEDLEKSHQREIKRLRQKVRRKEQIQAYWGTEEGRHAGSPPARRGPESGREEGPGG
jgi:hypothetical protein